MKPKVSQIFQATKTIAFLFVVFCIGSISSYVLIGSIFNQSVLALSSISYYLICSIVGLFFSLAFMVMLIVRARSAAGHGDDPIFLNPSLFKSIMLSTEKISKGDFNVHLDHDIKEDNQLQRPAIELVQSVNKMAVGLNQIEMMRQEFVTNVSHEIQSPLMSISGFVKVLKNESLSREERLHYLNIIEAESIRLSRLSDNLIRLASLDSESIRFKPEIYRLDRQIRNLVLACEPQWSEKDINIEASLDKESIRAGEDLLSQVWINLIHNAIKFTPRGGSIHLGLCRKDDRVEFTIADTGIGISEDAQLHIFERFYKADKSRDRSVKGSGLGLSIVKKIVELHHGSIKVESKPGKGSTFIVSLPADI